MGSKRANATSFGGQRGNTPQPGPGRAPGNTVDRFRKEMQRRILRADTLRRLDESLKSDDNNEFLRAFAECADRGFGKAPQSVDVTSDGEKVAAVLVVPPESPDTP